MERKNIIYLLLIFSFFACTPSRITSSWTKARTKLKSTDKIMVIGILQQKDNSLRLYMEQHITDDLKSLGYKAYSIIQVYGFNELEKMKEKNINEKLRKEGIDIVLTIGLLDKKKERYFISNKGNNPPYGIGSSDFYSYYKATLNHINRSGYYATTTKYFWESNLYDLNNPQLLYSVQTTSFNPATEQSLAHEYGRMIINDMVRNNILSKTLTKQDKSIAVF